MLAIPYTIGFVLFGFFMFAIARRMKNPTSQRRLKAVGVVTGPVFFLVLWIFSGWERHYRVPVKVLMDDAAVAMSPYGQMKDVPEKYVLFVLERPQGTCGWAYISNDLYEYMKKSLTKQHTLAVTITYYFFQTRGGKIDAIDDITDAQAWRGSVGTFQRPHWVQVSPTKSESRGFECFPFRWRSDH